MVLQNVRFFFSEIANFPYERFFPMALIIQNGCKLINT